MEDLIPNLDNYGVLFIVSDKLNNIIVLQEAIDNE